MCFDHAQILFIKHINTYFEKKQSRKAGKSFFLKLVNFST